MSCGANHNRRVAHALNRRSTHVAKVATQTAKRKDVHKVVKRTTTRPATKKKTTAPKKHATKTAAATARAKAKAKAAKKFHLSAAVKARMRAKARATARAHALATLRKDHAAWLACHNRYRRSAPKVRHHDTRIVVRSPGGNRPWKPATHRRTPEGTEARLRAQARPARATARP